VLLANKGFINDVHSAASGKGMPGIRALGTTILCESTVAENIRKGIDEVLDEIIAALTRPLTDDEKNPKNNTITEPRIAFKGTYDQINEFPDFDFRFVNLQNTQGDKRDQGSQ